SSPLLVLGAAGVDIIAYLEAPLEPGTSNPARVRRSYGGVARNVAENLARLGHPVRLLSAVGEDESGRQVLAHTRDAGVDVSAVLKTEEYPTGFYMGVLSNQGRLELAVDDMRIMSTLTSDYLRAHEDLFHTSGLLFLDANLPEKTLRTAFSLARKAKIPVCADPTSSGLAGRLKKYLNRLYVITPNSTEASILTGIPVEASERESALEAARALVEQGVEIALVTLAEFGVVYATSETTGHIPAIRTSITDPTGAGDALTAAFLFGLLHEMDIDEAVRLGVSAASLTLRHPGAVCPDLSLERLYEQLPY
ncbi:MAG: ribokinase, partial [Anaerolineae bacterium]